MIRDEIKNLIGKAIKLAQKEKLLPDFKIPEIQVEHPEEKIHGDYSTNVAMIVANKVPPISSRVLDKVGKSSVEIANLLSSKLKAPPISSRVLDKVGKNSKLFAKVEVAGPGFINFTLSKKWLQKQVGEILFSETKSRETSRDLVSGNKAQVEFISANPTGPLHLGHGRGAFVGDTLANVLQAAGYKVEREYFINDAKKSGQIRALGKTALGKSKVYLTEYLKKKIRELNRRTTQNITQNHAKNSASVLRKVPRQFSGMSEGEAGYLVAHQIHKDIKKFITHKLKIKFDKWVFEEKLYQEGKVSKVEESLRKKGLVYEKKEAVWLKTSKFDDDKDRVLVKKDGQPTYLLPDIAYHKDKFERGFAKVIDIWGADHLGHIKPLKIGLEILGLDPQKLEILISQMVQLKKEGKIYKMSKRKGEVINLEWLIDEVGLDVVRFLYLMKSLDTQMEFDLDLAKERSEKNPVYYVQYAHARICSILRKTPLSLQKLSFNKLAREFVEAKLLTHPSELDLIRQLLKFPEMVEDTSKDYQVQRLPHYALEVASRFHYFYKCCRVISEDKKLRKARISLVLATKVVLEKILGLMGVSAPKRM